MSGVMLPLIVALLTTGTSSSEVLPVSGRLTTQEGRPVLAAYDVKFELLDDATATEALWSETQNIAFEGGFFTAYLGSVKKLPPELLRDHKDLHLRITIDGDVLAPFPLGAVPYAFSAKRADDARTLDGKTSAELIASFPDVARSGAFADLTGVPEGLADGDDDLLASLPCAPGQIPRRSGDTFVCSADLDTLGGLTCQNGEVAKWNGVVWGCTADRVLTESEVDALVSNNGYAAATNLAPVATSGAFADLTGVPAGLADGDDDLLASLPCAPGQIPRRSGDTFVCSADLDTLGGLTCQNGEVAKWNGFVWGCTADRVLTEAEVDTLVSNNGYAAAASLARVATTGAFADLGGIPAGLGDGDDDLLATVPCTAGSLLAFSSSGYHCVAAYVAAPPLVMSGPTIALSTGQLTDVHVSQTAAIAPAKIAGTAATLTGTQAFDGHTLVIDAANDRVGIGTASPAVKLAVEGTVRATVLEVTPRSQVHLVDPGQFVDAVGTTMKVTSTGLVAPEPTTAAAVGTAQATLPLRAGDDLRRVTCLLFDNQIRFDGVLTVAVNGGGGRRAAPVAVGTARLVTGSASAFAQLATVVVAPGSVIAGAEEALVLTVGYEHIDNAAGGTAGAFGFGGCEVEVITSAP